MARLKVLFVCSRNQWRSPTAERVFAKDPRLAVRSAGTSARARRSVRIEDLRWADVVLVMEHKHAQRIRASFARASSQLPMHVLDIPDEYRPMDPALVELLQVAVPALLAPYLADDPEQG